MQYVGVGTLISLVMYLGSDGAAVVQAPMIPMDARVIRVFIFI